MDRVATKAQAQRQPGDLVNVFTRTSNSRWQMFPGPTMPFGMLKLSPDNQSNVWNGGHEYTIGSISGFSHLHAMGLSGLSIIPTTGSPYANEGWIYADGTWVKPFNSYRYSTVGGWNGKGFMEGTAKINFQLKLINCTKSC